MIHSQVIINNMGTILKKELNKMVIHTSKYKYQINMNNIIQLLRANLLKLLNQRQKIKKLLIKNIKNKEPV